MNLKKSIKCINNKRLKNKLTIDKIYLVITEHNQIWKEGKIKDCWHIECDDKVCRSYPKYRFKEVLNPSSE